MTPARHVEADALVALREELVRAAGRRAASPGRVRRVAVVAVVIVGLLAAAAGAAELAGFSTGVPEVDELIDVERRPPPVPGSASEPLAVPIGDGVYRTVAYLAPNRSVCIVEAEAHRESVRGSFGGCPPLESVERQIERRGASWFGSSHGPDSRTYQLLVDGDVRSLRPLAAGDWEVKMTPRWSPEASGARALRLVALIDEADLEAGPAGDLPRPAYFQPPLELTYADGHTRVVEGR